MGKVGEDEGRSGAGPRLSELVGFGSVRGWPRFGGCEGKGRLVVSREGRAGARGAGLWKPSRREVLRLGGALAIAAFAAPALSACEGGGGSNGQLRFAAWGSEVDIEAKDRQIELYQQQNPSIQIEAEYTNIEQYFDKLATQASGGNEPDAFQMDVEELAEYADRGILLDFSEFDTDVVDTSNFEEGILTSATIGGALLALPLGFTAQPALVYDATVLEGAGIEPPGQDLTLEGFRDLAQRIAEATGEGTYGTSDPSGASFVLEAFIRGRGKEPFDEEGQLGYGEEDLVAWFTYWDELRQSGAAPPADVQAAASNVDFPNSLLIAGQAPMLFTPSSNALRRLQSLTENKLDLALYPKASEGAGTAQIASPNAYYTASARSNNREEAARFVSFCLNDPEAAPLLGMSYGVPPNREIADAITSDLEGVNRKHYDYVQLVSQSAKPPNPYPPGSAEVAEILGRTSEDIAFERATIEEAVDRFFSEVEGVLA